MKNPWYGTNGLAILKNRIRQFPSTASNIEIFESITPSEWSVLHSEGRGLGETQRWSVYRQICRMRQKAA